MQHKDRLMHSHKFCISWHTGVAAAISPIPAAAAATQAVAHNSSRSGPGCAAEGGCHVSAESAWPGRHAKYTEPHERCSSQRKSPHTDNFHTSRQLAGQVPAMHANIVSRMWYILRALTLRSIKHADNQEVRCQQCIQMP